MVARRSLTAYQLRWGAVRDFGEAVREEVRDGCDFYDRSFEDYEMRLYVDEPKRTPPLWHDLIAEFDEDLVLVSESNRALILVRFRYHGAARYVAFAFGHGRHMLDPISIDRRFGLRAALNAIYERRGGVPDSTRIRHVDAKTVAQTTMRTSRQASSDIAFEHFGIDVERDLLKAVTGEPVNNDKWGSLVHGGESVKVSVHGGLAELGPIAKDLVRLGRKKDYQQRFDWIDHVVTVNDLALLAKLRDEVVAVLLAGGETLALAPPERIEWDNIAELRYSVAPGDPYENLNLEDYLGHVDDQAESLSFNVMQKHRVEALNDSGQAIHIWSVTQTLVGEIELGGQRYLLEEGDFYQVEAQFLASLDKFVDGVNQSSVALPASPLNAVGGEQLEGDYNEIAAKASEQHLLLDKKTVSISRETPIEICDVLTSDRQFVHVKRHLGSSDLSHLFSQGFVSADSYLASQEFREAARIKIEEAEEERALAEKDPAFRGRFVGALDFDVPDPRSIEIVYAVIARWNGRTPTEALPFFSKINLRHYVNDLRRLGCNVSFHPIQIV